MIKLSIIIPVYNTANYLNNCLNSCLNQDIDTSKYEIIIVDDGSTDNSISIIKNFQENHTNISVIHKENGGVSSARNVGIKTAKGKYILFVDSDDIIEEYLLKSIISEIEKRKVDILILNSVIYENGFNIKEVYKFPFQHQNCNISIYDLYKTGYLRGSVCGVIFSRSFILKNEITFSERIKNGEDTLFMTLALLNSTEIGHFKCAFYKIKYRNDSASQIWDFQRVIHLLSNLNVVEEYIKNNNLSDLQLSILNNYTYSVISNALYHFFSIHLTHKFWQIKEIIVNSNLYPIKIPVRNNYFLKILLLNVSIELFSIPLLIQLYMTNLKKQVRRKLMARMLGVEKESTVNKSQNNI